MANFIVYYDFNIKMMFYNMFFNTLKGAFRQEALPSDE